MQFGFSLSPGGLLLPYHIGVLTSLSEKGLVKESTPLAGSSAGAIAVAAFGVGVNPETVMEGTIRINEKCIKLGGARGRLMPLLYEELDNLLPSDAHDVANNREGMIGLAFKEIFPNERNILQSTFDSREDFIEAVCNSSMFPFFTTNWPFILRSSNFSKRDALGDEKTNPSARNILPRAIIDGYFTVPTDRFGCPEFPQSCQVDRTITVSVFPHEAIGLTASDKNDRISAKLSDIDQSLQLSTLFQRATEASTEKVCWELFEEGLADAEKWMNMQDKKVLN